MRPQFVPLDPDYVTRVERSFHQQTAMPTLGISLTEVGPGWIELSLTRQSRLTQQHGFVHAGVLGAAMDSACGYSAFSLMPAGAAVLTVEYKINLLRPASDAQYRVAAWVVKPGKTITVCQATTTGNDDKPIATMTATIMTIIDSDLVD